MAYADKARIIAAVYALLGRPDQSVLPYQDVDSARIDAGMEVLKAIAANPQGGAFGSLSALATITNGQFLPSHVGKPGIPQIVPFAGADVRSGIPASPEEIDSYRQSPELFTGAVDGVVVPHDQKDVDGKMSPISCRYSIDGEVFKFTGLSAQVPLVQLTRSMADAGVPVEFEDSVIKLIPLRVVKPSSDYWKLANVLASDGKQDLIEIAGGAMRSRPVRNTADIIAEQKAT